MAVCAKASVANFYFSFLMDYAGQNLSGKTTGLKIKLHCEVNGQLSPELVRQKPLLVGRKTRIEFREANAGMSHFSPTRF